VLASATEWALRSDRAAGGIFNVLNGDQFRWEDLWTDVAKAFDMAVAAPQPMSLQEQMADRGPRYAP
jgi:nucleoside-diphosphate-sugar epimerase